MLITRRENWRSFFANHLRQHVLLDLALAGVIIAAMTLRISYAIDRPALDDAYITFRYVRNLARGLGFVYNPGEQVLGTTTPFYTLLLYPFALGGLDLLIIGKTINVMASVGNVFMVFLLARRRFGDWPALLSGMLLAISPSSIWAASTGMETELNVLILLGVAYAYISGHFKLGGLLSAVAVVTRPDDLIMVVVVFSWHFLHTLKTKRIRASVLPALGVFLICLLPWILFATAYFGSPIPSSIVGKAASYRVPVLDNAALYVEQFGFNLNTPRSIAATALFLLGLIQIIRKDTDLLIFPAYFVAYSASFVFSGARLGSGWYWQPLWPAYCILFSAGVKWLVDRIRQSNSLEYFYERFRKAAFVGIAVTVTLVWVSSLKARFIDQQPIVDKVSVALEQAGHWLNANSPRYAKVQVESIGAVGWFSDRYIVDEGGLVSFQIAEINKGIGKPDSFAILETFLPDFYLAWEDEAETIMSTPPQRNWFIKHYQKVISFGPGTPIFVLFQKLPD